jgi:glycosyltransferase involved in cell wall biosynthesis
LEAAHQVITPSEHLRGALARQMDISNEDWEVLPHGLCQAVGEVQKNEEHEGPLTVLSFGNRSAVKGTLDLVQAMAALPAGSARLIMPGSEVEEGFDDLLRAAAGDLELELPGRYSAEDLPLYAARADLAAFPSRAEESYGLVIEEALAMGLPVWVSDRGALPEVLTRAAGSGPLPGGILPAEDPAAWTRALEKLVEEPQRLEDARASIPKQPKPAVQAVQRQLEIYAKILDVLPAKDS